MNFSVRIRSVQRYLKESGLDAIAIDNPLNIFYLTGLELSVGTLLITHVSARLAVDNRYFEISKKLSPVPVIRSESGWLSKLLQKRGFNAINSLGFDSENTSYDRYRLYRKEMDRLKKESEYTRRVNLKPLHNIIRS